MMRETARERRLATPETILALLLLLLLAGLSIASPDPPAEQLPGHDPLLH